MIITGQIKIDVKITSTKSTISYDVVGKATITHYNKHLLIAFFAVKMAILSAVVVHLVLTVGSAFTPYFTIVGTD